MKSGAYIVIGIILAIPMCGIGAGMDSSPVSIEQTITARHLDRKDITVYISKLSHTLTLKIDTVVLKQYTCVFGGNPVDDKKYEGDKCTPEGVFHIQGKYPHAKWEKFIWIDYPNDESKRKFDNNRLLGKIPRNATIGGAIGIHGVPHSKSYLIDKKINWTLGCISLTDEDVNEVYEYVRAGMEVIITK